jgi:hypothetical protein
MIKYMDGLADIPASAGLLQALGIFCERRWIFSAAVWIFQSIFA